ncbi:MAG: serine/threonine-protein kinase, partial [Pirellulaceae bacterium]|nr:serine/threonine-protein kinase [Pirellulaceae bacterium]
IVLKGHQPKLGRHVAVKVLAPPFAASGAARQRFAREAQAAASVVHPHVLALHAVDATGPHPYLVMPFVDGESLQRRIDNQGPLPLVEVLRVGKQTADGLAAAHTQGLVHRDIKPANILLEDEVGRVLLTDFGLARAVDDATMTCSGVIAGTPQFMAPEQARGESLDHRADLFSLGSVLYAMSGGRPPFRAETTMGVLRRICEEHPRPLREINPDVPQWLEQLIQQLHAKQPDERIQSAQEVAELLGQCLAHVQQPQSSPLPAKLQRNERRMGWRQFVVRSLGAAALVAAVAVGTQHWWRSSPPADVSSSSQLQAPPSDFASEYHLWRELDTQLQAWDDEATQLEAELRDDWPGQATLSLENSNADLPTTEPSE